MKSRVVDEGAKQDALQRNVVGTAMMGAITAAVKLEAYRALTGSREITGTSEIRGISAAMKLEAIPGADLLVGFPTSSRC